MICDGPVRVERALQDDESGNIESDAAILERQLLADFCPPRPAETDP